MVAGTNRRVEIHNISICNTITYIDVIIDSFHIEKV